MKPASSQAQGLGSRKGNRGDVNVTKYADIIQSLCVDHQYTYPRIRQYLKNEFNVDVSERKIKSFFKNKDIRKNISYNAYFAMAEVSNSLAPLSLEFQVPREREPPVTPQKLKKELKRKLCNKDGTPKPRQPGTPDNITTALRVLVEDGVKVRAFPSSDSDVWAPIADFVAACGLKVEYADRELEAENLSMTSASESETSDFELERESIDHVTSESHSPMKLNFTEVEPRYRATGSPNAPKAGDRQYDLVPEPTALACDVAATVLSNAVGAYVQHQVHHMEPRIMNENDSSGGLTMRIGSADDLYELIDQLQISSVNTESRNERHAHRGKHISQHLSERWQYIDPDGSYARMTEITSYYLQQCWSGYDDLDQFDDADRVEARQKLSDLLARNHNDVLVVIYCIGTVLDAHDKVKMTISFYIDCWHCCEDNHSPIGRIGTTIMRFIMLQLQQAYHQLVREMLDDAHYHYLESLRSNFNPEIEFEAARREAHLIGQQPSKTTLILVLYQAWYLATASEPKLEESIALMINNLQNKTKNVMGEQHIVTIGFFSLMATNYAKMTPPQIGKSEHYLREIEFHLRNCPRAMKPLRHVALERLALNAEERGELVEAVNLMSEVFNYRSEALGARAGFTWTAGYQLWRMWKKQGKLVEAERSEAHLGRLFQDAHAELRRQRRWS